MIRETIKDQYLKRVMSKRDDLINAKEFELIDIENRFKFVKKGSKWEHWNFGNPNRGDSWEGYSKEGMDKGKFKDFSGADILDRFIDDGYEIIDVKVIK